MGNEVSAAKLPAADGTGSEWGREDAPWDQTICVDRCCGSRHGSEDKLTFVESGRAPRRHAEAKKKAGKVGRDPTGHPGEAAGRIQRAVPGVTVSVERAQNGAFFKQHLNPHHYSQA